MEGVRHLITKDCEKQEVQYEFKVCEIISCSPMVTEKRVRKLNLPAKTYVPTHIDILVVESLRLMVSQSAVKCFPVDFRAKS